MDGDVQKAIKVLQQGGIVIYPTDTAYGMGCRIDAPKSVEKFFRLRQRPVTMATPLLVDSQQMAKTYFSPPSDIVRRFMDTYWPGALTIVYGCNKELVLSPLRGGGDTVGLRMPNHEITLALISGIGVPIIGSSANFHGEPTPYAQKDISPALIKLADFVVAGTCQLENVSTVVDCSVEPFKIIRQGAVLLSTHI